MGGLQPPYSHAIDPEIATTKLKGFPKQITSLCYKNCCTDVRE